MNRKLLVAVDGSRKCLDALGGFARRFKEHPDLSFVLVHCVQEGASLYPGELWEAETAASLAEKTQTKMARHVFDQCRQRLTREGVPEERIEEQAVFDSFDPGQDILKISDAAPYDSIAVGRRGLSPTEGVLLGSVSSRVAQYGVNRNVWILDPTVRDSARVLIAVEATPECRALIYYTSEWIAPLPDLHYTILHILPPVPPALWDDGHILNDAEIVERMRHRKDWEREHLRGVEQFMDEARHAILGRGVPDANVTTRIAPVKQGPARDLLQEAEAGGYEIIVMGKRSFRERKPFLMGSTANKVLHGAKKACLCLVESP